MRRLLYAVTLALVLLAIANELRRAGASGGNVATMPARPLTLPTTASTIRMNVRVGLIVEVASRAVRPAGALATVDVLRVSDRLKVPGPDAVTGAALVVDGKASRDGANHKFVSVAVSVDCVAISLERTVPARVDRPLPGPMGRRLPYLQPEPGLGLHASLYQGIAQGDKP